MPRLWNETIEAHRRDVHRAIVDTAAELAAERGVLSVTMSQIAERVGIGRATLYKYFPDVEAILLAWHERQISGHLDQLAELAAAPGEPAERLDAVLAAYAFSISHQPGGMHSTELAAFLHRDRQVDRASQHLREMIRDLVTRAAAAGDVRDDVEPDELALFCLHALSAARSLPTEPAIRRLVAVTLAGLRPA